MTCEIQVHSISDMLVEWTPVGVITGFADGSDSIKNNPSPDGETKMNVSADGRFGTIVGNNRTNGELMIKLNSGSSFVGILRDLWHTNRFARGEMNVTNLITGESWGLECAVQKMDPSYGIGTDGASDGEFMFLYQSTSYTPAANSQEAITRGL